MNRVLIELSDGTELEIRRRSPTVIDAPGEPLDDEPSGICQALAPLAKCPPPSITTQRRMRGHLRLVRAA